MSFAVESKQYRIEPHPLSRRLYQVTIADDLVEAFLEQSADADSQRLTYVPYLRLVLAEELNRLLGRGFFQTLNAIVRDRDSGGFTVEIPARHGQEDFVRWATAITHGIGLPNFDAMTNNYYATFAVRDVDNSDSYLRQAYRLFTMHTDGTFVDEATDWLMMMKMEEANAVGGRSRLLHLDDWEQLEDFLAHPVASQEIAYKSPPSKNTAKVVHRTTFFEHQGEPCVCFIDQFAYPRNVEQARYLMDLSESMEASCRVVALELPVGGLVMLNNLFWLHGREAFQKHPQLNRVLMRQRGRFVPTLDATQSDDAASTANLRVRSEPLTVGAAH